MRCYVPLVLDCRWCESYAEIERWFQRNCNDVREPKFVVVTPEFFDRVLIPLFGRQPATHFNGAELITASVLTEAFMVNILLSEYNAIVQSRHT